jgi:hypothetical protein
MSIFIKFVSYFIQAQTLAVASVGSSLLNLDGRTVEGERCLA